MIRQGTLLVGVGCALACVFVGGCAHGELRQVLRAQIASELDCPEIRIEYKDLRYFEKDPSKERYWVTGCGVERTYTCPQDPGLVSYDDEQICTFVEGDPDRPTIATVEEEEPMDEPMDEPIETPKPKRKPQAKAKPTGLPRAVEPSADSDDDASDAPKDSDDDGLDADDALDPTE